MSKRNPEYDFAWCPGCGDFGVRRALEMAIRDWTVETDSTIESTVVVAGIGCSGNMVHLLEGPQPFGIHGLHGRTLPVALGVKMARPELNVVIVAGDGDYLSIGAEHIAPQAQRNLNVTSIIMDNSVYGLTKGQASPTTERGSITSTTPYGKMEGAMNPMELFLTMGVSFVASSYSSRVKDLSNLIQQGMHYPGFAIVHVQSPCTTYNDTHDLMKGNPKTGTAPLVYEVPEEHDPTDLEAAYGMVRTKGVPQGVIYRRSDPVPLEIMWEESGRKSNPAKVQDLMARYKV